MPFCSEQLLHDLILLTIHVCYEACFGHFLTGISIFSEEIPEKTCASLAAALLKPQQQEI